MSRVRLAVAGACLAALLLANPALAYDDGGGARPFEVFGGFSYLHVDTGGDALSVGDTSGTGFQAQFTYFVNQWLGIGAEIGVHSGDLDDLPVILLFPPPDVDFRQTTVLFGPRFRFARTEHFRAAAHAFAGVATGSVDVDIESPFPPLPLQAPEILGAFELEDTVPAVALGLTFDLQVDDRIAWRIVQPDILVTTYGDESQTHLRFTTGVTFSF